MARTNARQVKTLQRNPKERNHRDHRSKKNRRKIKRGWKGKRWEAMKKWEEERLRELEDEVTEQI